MNNQLILFPGEESLTIEKGIDFIDLKDLVQTRTDSLMGGIDDYPKLSLGSDLPEDRSPVKVAFHWLVGTAFIVNNMPDKKKIVHHRDNNRHDYRIPNLEWATHTYNSEKTNPRVTQQEIREQARQIHERK